MNSIFQTVAAMTFGFFLLACDSGGGGSANQSRQCLPNKVGGLSLRDGSGETAIPLQSLDLLNPQCLTVYAATDSDCGEFIENTTPDNWVLNAPLAILNTQNEAADLCFNKGASGASPLRLDIQQGELAAFLEVHVRWTPTEISGLQRWYRADSYLPNSDGAIVGQQNVSVWSDLAGLVTPYDAYAQSGREPSLNLSLFSSPTIRICGGSAGCSGVSNNKHMRVASSFNEFANTDFTIVAAVARSNSQRNYLLVNQSIGNNTGIFMGWTSNTNFRVGLNGPSGANFVDATVPAYSGTPTMEVLVARLNTGSSTENSGLQIYLNGTQVANNSAVVTQPTGGVTIPYIGTQRSDHNSAHFYLGDWMMYNRALSNVELQDLTAFLQSRYMP